MAVQSIYEITHYNFSILLPPVAPATEPTPLALNGVATDVTLPELVREVDTTKRIGELGLVPRPKTYNELELSFTIKAIFEGLLTALIEGSVASYQVEMTTCLQNDDGTIIPYTLLGDGYFTSIPFGQLGSDGLESEVTMMLWKMQVNIDDTEIIYDPRNYILSVNGTNRYANVKTIILP